MEIAISAARFVVSRALGPVSDGLLESWAACSELSPNVRDLKLELLYAQGMLDSALGRDVRNRHVRNPALGQLLLELRHHADRAEDVLDELDYFRIQDELEKTHETTDAPGLVGGLVLNARHTARDVVSKLKLPSCSCTSSVCQHYKKPKLKFNRAAMSKRMVEIVEQLRPLCAKVSSILDLELLGTIASNGTTSATQQGTVFSSHSRNTTPTIIEPKLYGRDKSKNGIVDDITHGKYSANNLTVLSIVGPGGLGKTTLTQHIYQEVKSNFQVWVWICVSQNFSANRLAQEIVKQLPQVDNEKGNESAEDLIEKRLQSKQFLLVLDDMWTDHEDEWKKLLAPFKKGETKGNVVIVTTRLPKVAQMVTTVDHPIKLERLSDEECMRFFKACVFDDKQTWEGHTDLHDVGWKIVKRLKGFPLAVKTVGKLLKTELTLDHWARIFESKEWEYQVNDDDIMPALKLSYNYLPFHLQQCFSYCALFPEDYEFGSEELIHLWIGLGFLVSDNQNKRMEDLGSDYLNDLVSHGFFQNDKKEDGHTYYIIHDLLHDLAKNVSAYDCLSIQGSNLWAVQIPASVRHMSIVIENANVQDRTTFQTHKRGLDALGKRLKATNLRTLMLFGENHGSFCKLFGDMFRDARTLRVVFLSGASYDVEDLLHSFSQFVHLRYLRIKGHVLNRKILAGSISRLYNLLVLDLKECRSYLDSTREMSNLVKIRHFLVRDDSYHSRIFEVGKLKHIRELKRFEVKREKYGFELNQLGRLLQLQGSLEIHNLEKVEPTTELEEIKLVHLHHLNRLVLKWDEDQLNRDPQKEQGVLERLKPHSNVQEVCIGGHGGHTYPTWLGTDLSIKNLECLCLEHVAWKSLPPPLGESMLMVSEEHPSFEGQIFENLKRLELVGIVALKKWSAGSPFSKLEVLIVKDCSGLTELPPFSHIFPNLKRLELVNIERLEKWSSNSPLSKLEVVIVEGCPKLMELPFSHIFPNLQQIEISKCEKLVSVPQIPWTSELCRARLESVGTSIEEISYSKNEQYIYVKLRKDSLDSELRNVLAFSNLSEIKTFSIDECQNVPLDQLQLLKSLKRLVIDGSSNALWPTGVENNTQFKLAVEQLKIFNWGGTAKELAQVISYFSNLSELELRECDSKEAGEAEEAEAARRGQPPLPLQIKELLENQSSLRSLVIRDCPMLLSSSSLPSFCCPFPTSLQSLELCEVKDDSMFTLAPLTNLTRLVLSDCEGLRSEDLWRLFGQGHLKELEILRAHKLFDVSKPWRMREQDLSHSSRLEAPEMEEEARTVAASIGGHFFSSLTKLELWNNDDMEHFTKAQSEALQMLTSLEDLRIDTYSKLRSLAEGLSGLVNLKTLRIEDCDSIRSLPKGGLPSSLVELYVRWCAAIRSLPKATLPSSLMKLEVCGCDAFRSLPKDSLPSSLTVLSIRYCPAIRSLPIKGSSLPRSLQTLDVTDSNKKLQRQCRKLVGTIPVARFAASASTAFLQRGRFSVAPASRAICCGGVEAEEARLGGLLSATTSGRAAPAPTLSVDGTGFDLGCAHGPPPPRLGDPRRPRVQTPRMALFFQASVANAIAKMAPARRGKVQVQLLHVLLSNIMRHKATMSAAIPAHTEVSAKALLDGIGTTRLEGPLVLVILHSLNSFSQECAEWIGCFRLPDDCGTVDHHGLWLFCVPGIKCNANGQSEPSFRTSRPMPSCDHAARP
ncbi:hypothetical protein U9M48_037572 [Paspalum notatum var. saurae]|uniref:AAA+ ATPase domain-containing protein n=1 Tax=Paspalum notatum var. saurae TaxID=547442 RepID=A0AAQ3XCJ5_PASNO